jgi:hypothetical protein
MRITDEAVEGGLAGMLGRKRWEREKDWQPEGAEWREDMTRALTGALPHLEPAIRADERAKALERIEALWRSSGGLHPYTEAEILAALKGDEG